MDVKELEFRLKRVRAYLDFAKTDLAIAVAANKTIKEFQWRSDNNLTDWDELCFILECL